MRIKRQNRPSEADGKWAGSRETNLDSGRGRTCFLTSPFIELFDDGIMLLALVCVGVLFAQPQMTSQATSKANPAEEATPATECGGT
ncbi:MAG: hypothetical protein DMG84_16860 [Acidobacteria bacterium]|nr:MAG: hypothetical protein DMG84_16860 [Acidobacteriota bacterium]